jgi:hypothetical protein
MADEFLWEMCLANAEAKSYVLVSQLDPEVYSKYVENKESAPLSGFSFAVISLIHLAGGKSSEGKGRGSKLFALVRKFHGLTLLSSPDQFPEDLWHQLKRLGLKENDENHPVLGNNKQALELLVQQRLVWCVL